MAFEHVSVLLNETVDGLNVKPDGVYVDAAAWRGGHAQCRLGSKEIYRNRSRYDATIKAAENARKWAEKMMQISSYQRTRVVDAPQLQNIGQKGKENDGAW